MKKNMGTTDRIARLLLATVFVLLFTLQVVTGVLGLVLLLVGIVFALTSVVGFCPLYTLLGINTCRRRA